MTTIQAAKDRVRWRQNSRASDSAGQGRLSGRRWIRGRVVACGQSATGQGWSDGPTHGEAWVGAVASHPVDPPESKGGGMAVRCNVMLTH